MTQNPFGRIAPEVAMEFHGLLATLESLNLEGANKGENQTSRPELNEAIDPENRSIFPQFSQSRTNREAK
jgi:hypothetical protein